MAWHHSGTKVSATTMPTSGKQCCWRQLRDCLCTVPLRHTIACLPQTLVCTVRTMVKIKFFHTGVTLRISCVTRSPVTVLPRHCRLETLRFPYTISFPRDDADKFLTNTIANPMSGGTHQVVAGVSSLRKPRPFPVYLHNLRGRPGLGSHLV